MAITTGDYRIHSCYNKSGSRRHVLNLDSGKVTNKTRIYTTVPDGTREQIWYYNNNRLYTEAQDSKYRNSKCLDRLNTSDNFADIYDDNDDTNQLLTIIEVPYNPGVYRIKLTKKNLYLTTNKETGIGSCKWETLKEENLESQMWIFERLIRVEKMPSSLTQYYGAALVEYFSGCTNWKDGAFNKMSQQEPQGQNRDVSALAKKLYRKVFHMSDDSPVTDGQCLYNFPGALACGQPGNLNGYFHYGIDMVRFEKAPVYPFKDGTYFGSDPSCGAIGIKHSFKQGDYVFWYLHMNTSFNPGNNKFVSENTRIGTVSDVGVSGNVHLHIEVQPLTLFDLDLDGNQKKSFPRNPRDNTIYIKQYSDSYFGAYDLLDFIAEG